MSVHLNRATHFFKPHGQLHVVTTCFNPQRFIARQTLLTEFIGMVLASPNATLTVVEVAFGQRPFELEGVLDPRVQYVQYRATDELWLKESAINAAIARLPHDWKYVAQIDADVAFVNPNWVQETIQQLQHFHVVQMFHSAVDLSADHNPINTFKGFVASVDEHGFPRQVDDGECYYYHRPKGLYHPGYAWAYRRPAWNKMGGLLDINIVGGGDLQMAYGFYGKAELTIFSQATKGYRKAVLDWQHHARSLKQNIGFCPGTLLHYWHGSKQNRRYFDRWQILRDAKFDPYTDLKHDWQGLWQLCGNKPKLRDDLRKYLHSRQEDALV